jgi:hypothetical protein
LFGIKDTFCFDQLKIMVLRYPLHCILCATPETRGRVLRTRLKKSNIKISSVEIQAIWRKESFVIPVTTEVI